MEPEKILIDKAVLNKNYNTGGTVIPGIKMYYRPIKIKTI